VAWQEPRVRRSPTGKKAEVDMADKDFKSVFQALKAIMQPYQEKLELQHDAPDNYSLLVQHKREDGYQGWFGAVQIKKNYVSYHLMPVYGHPELLEDASPELKQRMQGKSCFNFKAVDQELFKELGKLTKKGFEAFKKDKLIVAK
jgi:hypothetical protein